MIIINLLIFPGYFDIALRDLGSLLSALALGRLSQEFKSQHLYTVNPVAVSCSRPRSPVKAGPYAHVWRKLDASFDEIGTGRIKGRLPRPGNAFVRIENLYRLCLVHSWKRQKGSYSNSWRGTASAERPTSRDALILLGVMRNSADYGFQSLSHELATLGARLSGAVPP